jgi:GTPase SAR1 family protein
MRFIKSDNTVRMIDSDDLSINNQLPAGYYRLDFNPNTGFYLTILPDMAEPTKMYGNRDYLIDHIVQSYDQSDRSLGVLLSGAKGIGKTLFANHLLTKMLAKKRPVVVVNQYVSHIADALDQLSENTIIFFDEFEKRFSRNDGEQDELLSLFDGTSPFKRMYLITINDTYNVSNYLLNRPGRFHYHLTFSNPKGKEVEEFLQDFIEPKYQDIIPEVVRYADLTSLTYDHLRAIAFEINTGLSLPQILEITNVPSSFDELRYDLNVADTKGKMIDTIDNLPYFTTSDEYSINTSSKHAYATFSKFYVKNRQIYTDIINIDEVRKSLGIEVAQTVLVTRHSSSATPQLSQLF